MFQSAKVALSRSLLLGLRKRWEGLRLPLLKIGIGQYLCAHAINYGKRHPDVSPLGLHNSFVIASLHEDSAKEPIPNNGQAPKTGC